MQVKRATQYGVILLLTTGLSHVCEAQQKQSLPNAPASFDSYSSEQTLQWIKSQLSSAKLSHVKFGYYVSYSNVSSAGCVLTFTMKKRQRDLAQHGKPVEASHTFTVPLGRLKSVSWFDFNEEGGEDDDGDKRNDEWDVELDASDGTRFPVNWTYTLRTANYQTDGSGDQDFLQLVVDDKNLAKRLADAFRHANELCGGGKQ